MSVRRKRAGAAERLRAILEREQKAHTERAGFIDALTNAHEALTAEPKEAIECEYLIHFGVGSHLILKAGECKECDYVNNDWHEDGTTRFCAGCGASIARTEIETDPRERQKRDLTRNATKAVLNGANQNG